MEPPRLNGLRVPIATGVTVLLAAVGAGGTWISKLYDGLHEEILAIREKSELSRADQAVDRSMILNFAHRMDALEMKIDAVRIAPTGMSAETRPRLDAADKEIRDLRSRLRELERRTP